MPNLGQWLKNLFSGVEDVTGAGELLERADIAGVLGGVGGVPDLTGAGEALRGADLAGAGAERLAEGFQFAAPDPMSLAATLGPMAIGGLTGSKTAGDVAGAAATTGIAGAQGFMNPISDLAALYSLYKMFKGFF